MRGTDFFQESLFTTVQLESFVPADHPLRPIKTLLDEAMKNLNWLFDKAKREVTVGLLAELAGSKKRTVGADKNYDTAQFVRIVGS